VTGRAAKSGSRARASANRPRSERTPAQPFRATTSAGKSAMTSS